MKVAAKDFLTGNITEVEEKEPEKLEPLEVKVTNQEKPKEISTSEDTIDAYDIKVTDEEIKEMQDAQ